MVKRAWFAGLFLAAGLLVVGCASTGAGVRDPSVYRREIGRTAYSDILDGVDRMLTKHGYTVRRFEDNYNTIYFETDWQPRELSQAEIDQGLSRARVRILIQGRRGAADLFRVDFLGENEGLRAGMSTWEKIDLVDEVERSLREVYDDLKMEMRTGIITR